MKLKHITRQEIAELNPKGKKVLLFSGGVDSYVISKLWNPDTLLYIDMNTKYSKSELQNIERIKDDTEVTVMKLDLGDWEQESAYIPNRNLLLLTIASEFGDTLCLGAIADDIANDKTIEFLNAAEAVLQQTHTAQTYSKQREIAINKEYKYFTKLDLLKEYEQRIGTLQELWERTYSCYSATPCWSCKPCFRKALAFMSAGYELPKEVALSLYNYFITKCDYGTDKTIASRVLEGSYHKPREAKQIAEFLQKYNKESQNI